MLSLNLPAADRSAARRIFTFGALLPLVCAMAAGCASATATRHARDAELRQDYDLAVVEYTKAARLDPTDTRARTGLERAKLRASEDHFQRGRRLAATGKYDQALVEYQVAAELNPTSGDI